eukprot:2550490-Amphidinium_carterae.2
MSHPEVLNALTQYSPNQEYYGLLTGYGLAFLAGKLSGPTVDRATLQLVGVLSASLLLPGPC